MSRVVGLLALAVLTGCAGGETSAADRRDTKPSAPSAPETAAASSSTAGAERPPRVERARCPAAATDCESASGRILYVERVDPDGDGDAHFVLSSEDSITAPGISVIDVREDLRPMPLPGPGEQISAAGPVRVGSYGQRQVEAEVVNVAPR